MYREYPMCEYRVNDTGYHSTYRPSTVFLVYWCDSSTKVYCMEGPCFTVLEEVFCVFAYIFVFLCLYLWICVHLDSNTSTVYDHEATLNGGSIISLQFGYLFLSFCICIFYLYLQLSSILCQCGDANVVYDYGAKPWMGDRWLTITLGNRNPQIYHRIA